MRVFRAQTPPSDHPRRTPSAADDGAAAVEFALVAPLLFLLLFGTIQYGVLFFQMQAASSTARNAARWAAVGIDTGDCTDYNAAVTADADANGVPADGRTVDTAFTTSGTTGGPALDLVTVRVHFTPTAYVPFVPFPSGIDQVAVARVEDTSRPAPTQCTVGP